MGTWSTYLIPESVQLQPEHYLATVKAALQKFGVIGERQYGDNPNCFSAGPQSLDPFENEIGWKTGFEYCSLYGNSRIEVVPQDPSAEPKCPCCTADVHEQYYEVVNGGEDDQEPNYESATITRGACGRSSRLDQLKDEVGIFLTNTYINFDDVPGRMRTNWLAKFEAETGIKHRVLEYWYT